jgi:hypothetical protein
MGLVFFITWKLLGFYVFDSWKTHGLLCLLLLKTPGKQSFHAHTNLGGSKLLASKGGIPVVQCVLESREFFKMN